MKKVIAVTTAAALLAGCSNIAEVNDVPVNRGAVMSTQNAPTYCEANPAICIIGAAIGLGAVGYLINQSNSGGNNCGNPAGCA